MGNTPLQKRREASYVVCGRSAYGSHGGSAVLPSGGKRRRPRAAASDAGRRNVKTRPEGNARRKARAVASPAGRRNVETRPEENASDEHKPVVERASDQLIPSHEENASDEHMAPAESASAQPTDDTRFLRVCRRMAPLGDGDLALRVAARAEQFYRRAGRRVVGTGRVNTLAWLSLAASFLGEDDAFRKKLHEGSREHRAALKHACVLGANFIGGSSVCV